MIANKEIRILLLQEGLSIAKLSKLIRKKHGLNYTADGISNKLRNNTLKFTEAEMIADTLDYDIVFVKKRNLN